MNDDLLQPGSRSAPVVLVHGLGGFDLLFRRQWRPSPEFFPGVRAYLESLGYRVFCPRISPTAGIRTRADELAAFLRREVGHAPVHLIGHSLGGLDGRYLISKLGFESQVLSLTTVGTPHWGSSFADWALSRFARVGLPLLKAAKVPHAAFHDLTTAACEQFNRDVPNVPGVRYLSVAGICDQEWLNAGWRFSSFIVGQREGPNDGIVSLRSARWGDETILWAGDHLNLVNWPNRKMAKHGLWPNRIAQYGQLLQRVQTP